MADGLLTSILGAIDRQKQATQAGLGLLVSNPMEFARSATARYFPTPEEVAQQRAMEQSGGMAMNTPYMDKMFNLAQFQGSIKPTGLLGVPTASNTGANVNPAEITARKAINDLVTQAKAYGIDSPVNYSNMPVGQALADLNQYLGQSQAVANLPDAAKTSLRNLFGNAENAGIAYQRVYGENKLMGKPEEAANKGTLSTKPPWFSQELENKLINKEITTKQYERQFMKNMENYFKK
jgi:hypothetical protein